MSLLFVPFAASAQVMSIAGYSLGQSSIAINLKDFILTSGHPDTRVEFIEDSLRWERSEKNLVTPKVLIKIEIKKDHVSVYFKSKDQVIIPMQNPASQSLTSQVEVNLFSPAPIQIFEGAKLFDEINLRAQPISVKDKKQWIDYSCRPYRVKLEGIETEYASVGCVMNRVGVMGAEKPRLEVTLSSTNLKTFAGDVSPFTFYFEQSGEVKTQFAHGAEKKVNSVTVSAKVPAKMSRLKLAGGFGPYSYTNKFRSLSKGPETTASVMLYAKLTLTETTSFKAFDALVYHDGTLFNNSGLYYSFDLARLFDDRVILGTLLGFQGLHYRYDGNSPTEFEITYPQGFELTYLHPFGNENAYLNFGAFLSTTQELYRNVWLRYGKKYFYEVNYIAWGKDQSRIEMWGLSVGFPLAEFF